MTIALHYLAALFLCLWLAAAVRLVTYVTCFGEQCRRCGRPIDDGEICGPCQAVERSDGE